MDILCDKCGARLGYGQVRFGIVHICPYVPEWAISAARELLGKAGEDYPRAVNHYANVIARHYQDRVETK